MFIFNDKFKTQLVRKCILLAYLGRTFVAQIQLRFRTALFTIFALISFSLPAIAQKISVITPPFLRRFWYCPSRYIYGCFSNCWTITQAVAFFGLAQVCWASRFYFLKVPILVRLLVVRVFLECCITQRYGCGQDGLRAHSAATLVVNRLSRIKESSIEASATVAMDMSYTMDNLTAMAIGLIQQSTSKKQKV